MKRFLDQLDLNSVKDYFYDFIDIPNRNGAFYLGQLGMLDCEGIYSWPVVFHYTVGSIYGGGGGGG